MVRHPDGWGNVQRELEVLKGHGGQGGYGKMQDMENTWLRV